MLKLARYLKPYWKDALAAPLLMVLEVVCDLMQPTYLARVVDIGVANGDLPYVLRTGLAMIGIVFLGAVGGVGCTITASRASMRFATDLRRDVFRKAQALSAVRQDELNTSSLVTRLTNDVTQVQNLVLMALRILVRSPLLFLGGIVMAVTLNPRLSLVLVVSLPILAAALVALTRRGFPLFGAVQERLDRLNTVMQENLSGVRVVKAYVREAHEKRRFRHSNDGLRDATVAATRVLALTGPIMMLVMNLSLVAVIWFGGLELRYRGVGVGQLMAFVNYLMQIMSSLAMVAFLLLSVSRAAASGRRLNEVLAAEAEVVDRVGAARPRATGVREGRVAFRDVSFRYPGAAGNPLLRGITFEAEPGEAVAILGATGSGKSTLVSLVPRFHDVTEGTVRVDGVDVRDWPLEALRAGIGHVMQDTILFSGTIRQNLLWGRAGATDAEVEEAARAAQAHEFIVSLPGGYDALVGQGGVNLSGGQKQRLAIARALVRRPAVLILDDCTSAVDMGTEARIRRALRSPEWRCTRLVIAQRVSTVLDAALIVILEDGEISAAGTHRELTASSQIYREICRTQLGVEDGDV